MFWSAEADTCAVLLTQMPIVLPAADNLHPALREPAAREDEDGTHMLVEVDGRSIRLVRLTEIGRASCRERV